MREPLVNRLLASTALAAALAATTPAVAQQVLPTGGSVASGSASIGASGSAMTIQQTTPRAVINWNSFSVGAPNSVTFEQPNAGSATLNRVTGSTPSSIAGQLNANGQVYLVNPNGVAITRGGAVNVGGGFVASTLGITDADFNNGKLKFTGAGASAAVSNDGTITAGPGGVVGLIGGSVSNSGTITAPLGKIALGSGEQATLDLSGDGFLQVALPTNATTADGKALVDVSGAVKAAGGRIAIKAATAANAVRNAINLSGVASARSARRVGGSIILGGGDGGDVTVGGALDASGRTGGGSVHAYGRNVTLSSAKVLARSQTGKGGSVAVSAAHAVTLVGSTVNVSGAARGGTIAIGGDAHGAGPLPNAATTSIDATSVLRADALVEGNGGLVTVWSNTLTSFAGLITARGGPQGGDGGSAEVSANAATRGVLSYTGLARLTAAHGAIGALLMDPYDIVISSGTDAGGTFSGGVYTPTATSVINTTTLETQLAAANVTISTGATGSAGADAGNITVSSAFAWSSGTTLTLNAANQILINADITVGGAGGLSLISGAAANGLQFAISDTGSSASVIFSNPTQNPTLSINGAGFTLLSTEAALQQMTATPGGNFALANDIGLTQSYTTSVVPDFYGHLEGLGHTLSGLTVTQGAATTNVGFFGILDAPGSGTTPNPPSVGIVSNLFIAAPNVNGGTATSVGALAGSNYGEIFNSGAGGPTGAEGLVTGTGSAIGGLVGSNIGLIQTSFASVTVVGSTTAGSGVGGMVGENSGAIVGGLASGTVSGDDLVGGLAGLNDGYVNSGASGFASGNTSVGGVVGENTGTGETVYFNNAPVGPTGTVTGSYGYGQAFGTSTAGGLVGLNAGAIDTSFFNGPVAGDTNVGGLVGQNTGSITSSYAIGPVTGYAGAKENIGGLVGANLGSIDSSFAMGAVSGTTNVGGLVGLQGYNTLTPNPSPTPSVSVTNSYSTGAVTGTTVGGLIGATGSNSGNTITNAYWDTDTSGQPTVSAGGVGYATAALQGGTTLPFNSLNGVSNFSGGAAGGETNVYPYLNAANLFPNGVHAVSGFAFTTTGGALASGANGPVIVYGDFGVAGSGASTKNPATTGANGYYYIFAAPAVVPAGADVLVYTNASTTTPSTGATNAATYVAATGANNQTGVSIFANTLTETTALATYSGLVAAVANATAGDSVATGVIDSINTNSLGAGTFVNITSTATDFLVDTAITTAADLTIAGTQTTLAANVTATGGVNLDTPVVLASTVTVDSGTVGTFFASTVDGSATPGAGLTVNGPATLNGDVTTSNGAIAFNGAVSVDANLTINSGTATTTFGSTIDSGSDGGSLFDSLTGLAGAFSFGGAVGGQFAMGAVAFTSTAAITLPSITANTIFAQSTGASLTIGTNATLTALAGTGTAVTLVAASAFINDSGPNAIVFPTDPPNWLIYSNNPTADVFNGLNSNNQAIWNTTYPDTTAPTTGNFYIFAYQPIVTFTSINDSKTYGTDATAKVATDYAVSGINPGVANAYLPDTAATAYSGTPSVTSAGSPASATVAGGPYAIAVAAGSVTALNGYAAAFVSSGALAVNAEAITVTATANSKTYDSTTSAAATPTVTAGTLYDAATLSETYATPNAGTGITLNPAIAFATPSAASNYTVTLTPAALGTITPEPITVTATANSKVYNDTVAAAATPTVTAGTLYDAATLSETYATPNAGTGITLNPAIAFASPAAASNYTVTLTPAALGTITPEPITVTATANSKVYNATVAAAATPTVTTGTLYDAATLSETYATPNAGTGITLNPAIAFASPAAASNYTVTLTPAALGTITPEPITVTATANSKVYNDTVAAAATPTVTAGTLYDAATLSETYATPNAGTGITLNPAIAFASPAAASNYTVTLTPAALGTITPEPITVTATANSKVYNATVAAAATPTVTAGTLYDAATLSETYATPNAGTGITLNPAIAFASPSAASNYTVTLTPAALGTITPEPITITATANSKVFDTTTSAAATPTVTTGALYDAATLAETYATPNAGTRLTLNPTIAFANPSAASNYTVTLAPAQVGTITPEPITVTATANTKVFDTTTSAAATPTVTAGTLYDSATLSETYATPFVGTGLTLTPQIAFAAPAAASNYAVTLTAAPVGTITPEPITVTAAPNAKTYDGSTSAAATPTVTSGVLYYPATLSETYAAPNAGTNLTLIPYIGFSSRGLLGVGSNFAITLASTQTGTITPEPITVTATPNTKIFDGNTSAAALPVLTSGTLFDPATLSESYATPGPGNAINLIPAIAFNSTTTAGDYAVTLVPTGTRPPNTGAILPPTTLQINLSPSVFVNRNPLIGIPGGASTCGPDVQLPDPASFADPVAAVQAISAATSQYVERCRDASQEDIANALERYADALQVIIEKLPPKLRVQLQHIPQLVRAAAVRARAAPTRAAAVRVLRQTVAIVHHEITLVRADDPDSARVRNAVSAGVSGVLNTAAVALARSEGI